MKIKRARSALDDTSFLKGSFTRASALKELAEMEEPEAAEALVSAVDENSPSAAKAREILDADRRQGWGDRLWEIWSQKRQPWLREILLNRKAIFSRPDSEVGVLSRLLIGGQWKGDAGTAGLVSAFLNDPDTKVREVARKYFDGLQKHAPKMWIEILLRAKLFDLICGNRKAAELLNSFLHSEDSTLASSVQECISKLPVSDRVLVLLLSGREKELPLDRETAIAVAGLQHDVRQVISIGAMVYLDRVMASGADFAIELAFKTGHSAKVAASVEALHQAMRYLRDADAEISAAAYKWMSVLPREALYHDIIVDEWLRTDDENLFKLLRFSKRFPSDPGREILLRLLCGDIKGYLEMVDPDCGLLATALATASDARRKAIVKIIEGSHDEEMADRLRRAVLLAQSKGKGDAFFMCDRK
jgi:hypothetical protein